ncbi:MAG TPA: delta-60 repeat domain-containing protein, partial [Actinomycetota bacterium]|nr:delta-60 repeat domain-containing protein [Actinomycetota bacterium]
MAVALAVLAILGGSVAAAVPAEAVTGAADPTFAAGGQVSTDLGGTYDWAYATALQPDGEVLAAGVSNAKGTYDFALVRYTAAGALDPSFGEGGRVLTDFGGSDDWAHAIALQPDGRIVLGGVSDHSGSRDFALARYNPDGSLDHSFGEGGLLVLPVRPLTTDIVRGLALQPDGKILAAGVTFEDRVSLRPQGDFMLVRYTPAG